MVLYYTRRALTTVNHSLSTNKHEHFSIYPLIISWFMSNSLSDLFVMSYFKIQLLFFQNKTNCCFLFHHHYYKRKTWRLHFGPSITIGVFLINPSSHSCGFKQLIDWFHQGLQIVSLYVYMFKTGCSIKKCYFYNLSLPLCLRL